MDGNQFNPALYNLYSNRPENPVQHKRLSLHCMCFNGIQIVFLFINPLHFSSSSSSSGSNCSFRLATKRKKEMFNMWKIDLVWLKRRKAGVKSVCICVLDKQGHCLLQSHLPTQSHALTHTHTHQWIITVINMWSFCKVWTHSGPSNKYRYCDSEKKTYWPANRNQSE